jgi:hypothetical protein
MDSHVSQTYPKQPQTAGNRPTVPTVFNRLDLQGFWDRRRPVATNDHFGGGGSAAGEDDPFGPAREQPPDMGATPAIPDEVAARFPGRWVLLRGKEVIADANDLPDLLRHPARRADDLTAYVRDPQRAYG